jgi:hypothetical protein
LGAQFVHVSSKLGVKRFFAIAPAEIERMPDSMDCRTLNVFASGSRSRTWPAPIETTDLTPTRLGLRAVWVAIGVLGAMTSGLVVASDRVDFNRDVRPILSNHCWNCHGPDEHSRKAGLRLDQRESTVAKLESGVAAVVPHAPGDSELVVRIDDTDENSIMPPPAFKRPLSAKQKDILKRWIAQGAEFAGHWAYESPKRLNPADLPLDAKEAAWPRNAIDRFVLAKLHQEGVAPSAEASRSDWLRRVSFDLTGLPPSPAEVDAFLADASPEAHERVVDRLLASPAHAERMAMGWLDAARYADTNGYNNDEPRTMWPWRDWVIRAFAENLPYDQFLTQQLAGDLLPNPTLSQKVATGFARNHVLTTEGGIIEEEYHVEYVADRVHTVSTVFLAMSMQCARCHDHKYDPLTQKDYYAFAGFFNNLPDKIVSYSKGPYMADPLIKVPTPEQTAQLDRLTARQTEVARLLTERATQVDADLAAWEAKLTPAEIETLPSATLVARFDGSAPATPQPTCDLVNLVDSKPTGRVVGTVTRVPGKLGDALEFTGSGHVDCGEIGAFEADQSFTLSAWVFPTSNDASTVLSKMDDAAAHRGYDLILEGGKVASHIVHHWPDKGFKIVTKQPLPLKTWSHVALVYTGTREAAGATIYVNGQAQAVDVTTGNKVEGTLKTDKPFHIGRRNTGAPFQGQIDEVQLYSSAVTPDDVMQLAAGQALPGVKTLLAIPAADRTAEQRQSLRAWYLRTVDPVSKQLREEQAALPAQIKAADDAIPYTMIMGELEPRRPSYFLKRGQYDQKGDIVPLGVPASLPALPEGAPQNRLGFARWLTSPNHPLTARVAVNRWWELFFGTGLVETTEDFGIQGAYPSHPELLDWLATELIAQNWDTRAILKQIALSATYRQSSHIRADLAELDPANRWLARGPRNRLPAETIRDAALFHAGLLSPKVGGPSVKPYQPEGLWEDVSVERREKYAPDPGDGIYRRGLYTFWKRTCPPPSLSTFDAPDRETCLVRRARTNTPLQALVLMNDPTYVEAARKLAERALAAGLDAESRAQALVKIVLAREATPAETEVLVALAQSAQTRFATKSAAVDQLLAVGRAPVDERFPRIDVAAWTTAAMAVLNLSEAITKP